MKPQELFEEAKKCATKSLEYYIEKCLETVFNEIKTAMIAGKSKVIITGDESPYFIYRFLTKDYILKPLCEKLESLGYKIEWIKKSFWFSWGPKTTKICISWNI